MIDLINYFTKHVVVRFILAGGTSAVVDLVFLYLFNKTLGMHYLTSAILAFLIAFCVSFTLHKFWTFRSHGQETHKQVVIYFGTSLFGLFLNTLLMYLFVDYILVGFFVDDLPTRALISQVIVGIIVAFSSFFISRNFVFKYNRVETNLDIK